MVMFMKEKNKLEKSSLGELVDHFHEFNYLMCVNSPALGVIAPLSQFSVCQQQHEYYKQQGRPRPLQKAYDYSVAAVNETLKFFSYGAAVLMLKPAVQSLAITLDSILRLF